MSDYKPTIGLEIHAELKTRTKMFCDSKNDPDEREPNVNVCPVCMAHPGTLPVINKAAVKHVLKVGVAFDSELADFTEFDRKNYFYPDIPKGYQISQYKYPLVSGGSLNGVEITRVHLEEDTARSTHDEKIAGEGATLIDFNRAGIPLMELVTEPVIRDAETAGNFARELQTLLRILGASDANMEKGEMRVEANISVSKDLDKFGTKVEVKNLNSFKSVERAIAYEIERQIEELESGGEIVQETRGWDENKGETYSQRKKEGSADYRYFPDPDLPKLHLSKIPEFSLENLKKEMPELPWETREKLGHDYGLKDEDIEVFISDKKLLEIFYYVAPQVSEKMVKTCSNYLTSDLVGLLKEGSYEYPDKDNFLELMKMLEEGELSSRGAKDILPMMLSLEEDGDPKKIAESHNLIQKSDEGELKEVINKIIEANPDTVAEYKGGKDKLIQFFVGQGMKETRGSANPGLLKKLFEEELR